MTQKKKIHPLHKSGLHLRNKHRERYDFKLLTVTCPELGLFVRVNEYGDESIDFFDPEAVRMLNKALLKHYYDIEYWDIPAGYLCPPIPGRAEYIHRIADLLVSVIPKKNDKQVSGKSAVNCLDIGVGANCVYPIIGVKEYGWSFVGSDIDPVAIASASKIVESNPILKGKVELRLQNNPGNIFKGIIQSGEQFDITICNPPFHVSREEAEKGTLRKLSNLKQRKISQPVQNFAGQHSELWCEGGEVKFVADMIRQSRQYAKSCLWFSSLISKQSHLDSVYSLLRNLEVTEIKTLTMSHGNKNSRIVAWTWQ